MPTLHARGVTVQVSVADLAKTTFSAASLPLHNPVELQFLGDDRSGPFYMAHIGKDFFNIKAKKNRNMEPKRMPTGIEVCFCNSLPPVIDGELTEL